ncbi:MAG: DUF2182 domain-containing protein [Armatimonadota bacterium]|nr:DUF2182 domain-containing protein [Armatimonadota bacterium]
MLATPRTSQDRLWYGGAVAALIASAWGILGVWGASPHAAWLGHRGGGEASVQLLIHLGIFVVAWTLMTVAMMLPGSLPLVRLFGILVRERAGHGRLVAGLVAGYLLVWAGFGVAAFVGDLLVHALIDRVPGMGGFVYPAVLLTAGAYQFTSLKDRCLTQCRSPYTQIASHWRGFRPMREAMALGVRHGEWCVGCCWVLMLVMFAAGVGHLGWMLALGAVMAAERATPWGRRVSRPVGLVLMVWAIALLAGTPSVRLLEL